MPEKPVDIPLGLFTKPPLKPLDKPITPPKTYHPIQIKPGVVFKVINPEIWSIFPIISEVFASFGKEAVITSANDGKHKGWELVQAGTFVSGQVSKHYFNLALDLRTKHLLDMHQKEFVIRDLKDKLGPDYLVLLESPGTDNEHAHIGFKG